MAQQVKDLTLSLQQLMLWHRFSPWPGKLPHAEEKKKVTVSFFDCLFLVFLGLNLKRVEVPRLAVELES